MTSSVSSQNGASVSSSGLNDLNCRQYDYINKKCRRCASRFFLDTATSLCRQVDSSCRTYNFNSGDCLTCYTGYSVAASNPKMCKV